MIKRFSLFAVILGSFMFSIFSTSAADAKVSMVKLTANLGKTNSFTLTTSLETEGRAKIKLIGGEICVVDPKVKISSDSGSFWVRNPKGTLVYSNKAYYLKCPAKGKYRITLNFVSKVHKNALMRKCSFYLLPALLRKVNLNMSSQDIEPEIENCSSLQKYNKLGYTGTLQASGDFVMKWKKLVDNKTAALAVNAEVFSAGSVLTGAVKLNTRILYKIFQGKLKQLRLRIPKGINVLAVKGKDIRDWSVAPKNPQIIIVDLNNEKQDNYTLDIQAEKILADTPCTFTLNPIVPENVMRLDGALRFGSGRGVKLLVEKTPGLVQIDNNSFSPNMIPAHSFALLNPQSYNFSSGDYQLQAKAENISPSCNASLNCLTNCGDRALRVRLECTLEIKDAPLRELTVQYEPSLSFSRVYGRFINPQDYDLIEEKGTKKVKISFRKPVFGKVAFSLYFERELKKQDTFNVPSFKILGAKSVRGYLMLAVDRGLELEPQKLKNLTPVHPGSLPLRQKRLQFAYLFRNQDWTGSVKIKHVKGNIISEIFNLVSAGEGTAYGSSIMSFHISGAPVDHLRFIVGDNMKNLEFKGRGIISRKKIGNAQKGFSVWEVKFRQKQLGDITMLATYEISFKDGGTLRLGAIASQDSGFSSSYTALAGVKSLKVNTAEAAPAVQEIDQSELPQEYLKMINNPLLKIYRGAGRYQWQDVKISRYSKFSMPRSIIDRTELATRLDENGGSVTTVQYRIKNSTGQFLSIELPAGSDLWSVNVDGHPRRLSVNDGKLLIPLPRHRNINLPIAVKVVYARQFNRIKSHTEIPLEAPRSDTKSLFTQWHISVPENCAIVGSNRTPTQHKEAFSPGFSGIIERIFSYANSTKGIVFMVGWIGLTVIGVFFLFCLSRDYKIIGGFILITTILGLLLIGGVVLDSLVHMPLKSTHTFIVNQAAFNRVMGLGGKAFKVTLQVQNMEASTWWNIISATLAVIGAAVLVYTARKISPRLIKALCFGGACTLVIFAASQWFNTSIYAALALALLIPAAFTIGIWLCSWRCFRRCAAALLLISLFGGMSLQAKSTTLLKSDSISIQKFTCNGYPLKKAVKAIFTYHIKASRMGRMQLVAAPAIITEVPKECDSWEIIRDGKKYILVIKEKGEFIISVGVQAPIITKDAKSTFSLPVPECISNNFLLNDNKGIIIPSSGAPSKVNIKSRIKALNAITMNRDYQTLQACFSPGAIAHFEISGKTQKAVGAPLTFFAKGSSLVKVGRGSTEINNNFTLNIPQGNMKVLEMRIPVNMRVTSVKCQDLEAWRFNRKDGNLKVFFSKPQNGICKLLVNCQIAGIKLPAEISLSPIKMVKAAKQYGSIGIMVDREVKISVSTNKGFTAINNDFFGGERRIANTILKKAFRYAATDAEINLNVVEVKPELRVVENSKVSFEDERITLDTELQLNVIKGGIFSIQLNIPKGFEINRLNGPHIQHWDEISSNGTSKAVVTFEKRLSGKNTFTLALSKMISEDYKSAEIPAVRVTGVSKHIGTLNVEVEKGTSISVIKRHGVSLSTADMKFSNNGTRFKLLRPDWHLKLAFTITPPWIQVKTLQNVKIKAHNIECNTQFNFSIENAGVKRFHITLPSNCAAPEFSGRYVRSAGKMSGNTWVVELDRKVERGYHLKLRCQLKLDKDNILRLLPFVSPDSGIQTGYIALFAEESLQLKTITKKGELSNFNSRNIPSSFGSGNLANAILCFRSVGKEYSSKINVIRHQTASTLKATVNSVDIKSLIAESGQVLSKAKLVVNNANETFLPLQLPEGATLWAAFVDSTPVEAVKSDKLSLVPLKQDVSRGNCTQTVEFIYSIAPDAKWTPRKQGYEGPLFGLPLKNIKWEIFLPEKRKYSAFDGTLKYKDEFLSSLAINSISDYDIAVKNRAQSEAGRARKLFSLGRSYIQKGYNKKAFEVLNKANSFTGNKALQSDIRGQQLLNSRMQNIYSLSQRRSSIAQSSSIQNKAQTWQPKKNMQALRQQMGDEEIKNLQAISDKIYMQQQAATSTPRMFDINIPWKGKKITFERALEIRKDAPLEIKFKSSEKLKLTTLTKPILFAAMIIVFALLYLLAVGKKKCVNITENK